jgi:multidrug efflux pump subunit AcrA (membrane-fusion protein)
MSGQGTDVSSFDQPSGLLPTDPPARAVRWTGWLLLALALAAMIFAVSFRLPDVVVAPFVIVPVEGTAPIQAPVAGLLANVQVRAGQRVLAGDELFVLRSDALRDADARLRQLHEDQRALTEQVAKRTLSHASELAASDAQIGLSERELGFRQQHYAATRTILERKEKAVKDGLLPQLTVLSDRLVLAESETARVLAEQQLQQVKLKRQQQLDQRSRERTDEAASAEKLRVQIDALTAQLATSAGDLQSIRAPYDAMVLSVAAQTPGSVIAIGAELCQLARLEAAGQAQLSLPEAQMQRLRIGQGARLFLTAYPYQRYGSVPSEIAWISPAPISGPNAPSFIALATLQSGREGMPVRIGMTGEARVLVGRRTLLELALEPIRGLREKL